MRCKPCCVFPVDSICPECLIELICPIFSVSCHYFSHDPFQSLVCRFHLAIDLWMVGCTPYMFDFVLVNDFLNQSRSELSPSVCYYFSWHSISNKDFFRKEIDYCLLSFPYKFLSFCPFNHIICTYQDVLFPFGRWINGSNKVQSPFFKWL